VARSALACALLGLCAAALPSPGLYAALGLGIAAIGLGWLSFRRRELSGPARLGGAAAMTLGGAALSLGALRVVIVLAALGHIERLAG
jgi:hypothetical protein